MRPALDPAGYQVHRTKHTCLLHTWRPHRQRPFALVLHLHQHLVKLRHAPAILSQESVHTTLSITHHTRKQPSTSPRTTHGPQSPPWWVHWQRTHIVTQKKRKETNKRNFNKRSKAKEKQGERLLEETSLRPLRQGQRLDTSETKHAQAKSTNHQSKARKPQRAPPALMQAPTEPMQLPQDKCTQTTSWNRAAPTAQLWPVRPVNLTGQTDGQDRPAPGNYTGQTGALHRLGRCHLGNCPSSKIARNHLENF
jgi:hypothetical protein